MKSRNIWNVLIAAIGVLMAVISFLSDNPEAFGIKSEWVAMASLILLGIKQFIEQSGLLTPDEANEQTARFANNLKDNNVYLKHDNSNVTIKDVENWKSNK